MAFPPPSPRQARILWASITALSIGVIVVLLALLALASGWIVNQLSSVLLPLAVAGVLAYILDPLVDAVEQKAKVARTRAILLVFALAVLAQILLAATVVPQLIGQTKQLIDDAPSRAEDLNRVISTWFSKSEFGAKAREAWDSQYGAQAKTFLTKAIPAASQWLITQVGRVASWAGLLAGLALVPVYVFYFLQEKSGIQKTWTDYLPLQESRVKQELVFVISAINDYLIVFFRGQVLVAACVGAMLAIGFTFLGLKYALILGVGAGILGIIPYLGVMISLVPAVLLAIAQFRDWTHPLLVLAIFGLAQLAEGLVISPKIIGDRVGLHPMTIIIAVMVGTTLLGGIIGGVLAIPLTAALRVLMFRYVWKARPGEAHAP